MRPHNKLVLVCALALAGCGDSLLRGEVTDLHKRLDEAQRRAAIAENKLGELEDRVFLLTDQVESAKVQAQSSRAPRLPVVTLHPHDAPAQQPAAPADDAPPSDDITYEGDARSPSPDRVRPTVVHLDESALHEPARARRSVPASSPPSTSSPDSENLGVVKAPPIAAVLQNAAPPSRERETPASDPLKLYRAAYDDLRAGRHDEAVRGFREFVRRYPKHDYADNAQYWLGECFYDRKQYLQAADEFQKVVVKYPLGNKAPDALLKLGYCMIAVGDAAKGRELLAQVPSSYPRTEAARLAEERLAQLKEDK